MTAAVGASGATTLLTTEVMLSSIDGDMPVAT